MFEVVQRLDKYLLCLWPAAGLVRVESPSLDADRVTYGVHPRTKSQASRVNGCGSRHYYKHLQTRRKGTLVNHHDRSRRRRKVEDRRCSRCSSEIAAEPVSKQTARLPLFLPADLPLPPHHPGTVSPTDVLYPRSTRKAALASCSNPRPLSSVFSIQVVLCAGGLFLGVGDRILPAAWTRP